MNKKAIFLTHSNSLHSEITGGVQLCSQEFYGIISLIDGMKLEEYHVPYTKNIFQRIQIKIGMENYSGYDVKKDSPALISYIRENEISIVYINMASLVRYAKVIKDSFGENVKVVLLSHGNHSGDFLHLITKPLKKESIFKRFFRKLRLGLLVSTESEHRIKYLDAVITLSETEMQIENWFGAKRAVFLPRRLTPKFLEYKPVLGRVGFVGRLDHPPNLQGIKILLKTMQAVKKLPIELRVVGAPENYGRSLQKEFPFICYLGELTDKQLETEVATWTFLLNPVWWYSTGASTKLGKAISWGVPIITTSAGMRGYYFEKGQLLIADSPELMRDLLSLNASNIDSIMHYASETKKAAQSGLEDKKLAQIIANSLFEYTGT